VTAAEMTCEKAELVASMLERRFNADVDLEPVNSNGRYQFALVSPAFSQMTQLDRQDEVWSALRSEISDDISIDVLMVLAFSPEEFAEAQEPL
jgi:stress-induced morphogen